MNPNVNEAPDVSETDITDNDIAVQKEMVGLYEVNRHREFHSKVSTDTIRNFALSIGDDNPLYTDEDYAKATRWGSVIAPSIMLAIINKPLLGYRIPREVKAKTRGLFKGCQTFMSGGTWHWYRPIYPGDTIYSYEGEESVEEKPSDFGGRTVHIIRRYVKFNQRGEVVGVYRALRIMAERKSARKKGKYAKIELQSYTADDIKEIDARYLAEKPRGNAPRFIEDVAVGDSVTPLQKGPLVVTDVFMTHIAGYGFAPYRMLASGRVAAKDRQKIPGLYSLNEQGVPDTEARVHWDRTLAKKVGNPEAYDWGLQREFWLYHFLSDWAGDDAFIVSMQDEIRKFNYMGDMQIISGEVTRCYQENGQNLVDISLVSTNQRDEKTVLGSAIIALPSKDGSAVVLSAPPPELQAKAAEFMAAHNRLSHGQEGGE